MRKLTPFKYILKREVATNIHPMDLDWVSFKLTDYLKWLRRYQRKKPRRNVESIDCYFEWN
jgi:hypothetical protein